MKLNRFYSKNINESCSKYSSISTCNNLSLLQSIIIKNILLPPLDHLHLNSKKYLVHFYMLKQYFILHSIYTKIIELDKNK